MNAYIADVHVGSEITPVGVLWFVYVDAGEKHWFGTRELATAYAARVRHALMTGEDF